MCTSENVSQHFVSQQNSSLCITAATSKTNSETIKPRNISSFANSEQLDNTKTEFFCAVTRFLNQHAFYPSGELKTKQTKKQQQQCDVVRVTSKQTTITTKQKQGPTIQNQPQLSELCNNVYDSEM